jgi:hypothetical protein
MGIVDADTVADAARRYTGLRRRYWQFFLGGVALFAVLGTPLIAFGPQLHPVARDVFILPLTVGLFVCWLGSFVTWHSLLRFRCPRCAKKFILARYSSWPTSACKHCGLNLGEPAPGAGLLSRCSDSERHSRSHEP